jgi:excisionase family DNA binding protein
MHRYLQFGIRENPASNRRHGSRHAVVDVRPESVINEGTQSPARPSDGYGPVPTGTGPSANDASPRAATANERQDEGRLLTVNEVAALLQVPLSWVYSRTRRRAAEHLPGYRLGKYWRFRREDIFDWVDRQRGDRHAP